MPDTTILILPGLDGTDLMLGPFRELCAQNHPTILSQLPGVEFSDYLALADHFGSILRELESCHIIAESFSGPIGILLAERHPKIVDRLTLVASFGSTPIPTLAALLPWSLVFRMPMPTFIARHFFVGKCDPLIPVLKNAVRHDPPAVLRHRLRLVQNVDVLPEYSKLRCKLSYIRPVDDRLVPRRCLDELLSANPDTIVHEMGGPHLILETQPANCWQAIAK